MTGVVREVVVPIADAVAYAIEHTAEVMVHPSFKSELAVLRSDA
jgi:hypothetical protein